MVLKIDHSCWAFVVEFDLWFNANTPFPAAMVNWMTGQGGFGEIALEFSKEFPCDCSRFRQTVDFSFVENNVGRCDCYSPWGDQHLTSDKPLYRALAIYFKKMPSYEDRRFMAQRANSFTDPAVSIYPIDFRLFEVSLKPQLTEHII